jgi:deoxyadenosine/deoxycytidine kinase
MSETFELVSIEGNIGSGKSTLLSNLKNNYKNNNQVIFLNEPVDEWEKIKDENGVTMLAKFYADQDKYSFPFQMMAYISRLKVLRDAVRDAKKSSSNQKIIIITERSLFTDKMVFAKMLYDTGKIEHINYQIYLNWFDTFAEEFPINKVIYVKTSPEICHYRISKRSREGESVIPIDYLESLNNYHDQMLSKNMDSCICQEQLLIDGNVDIQENQRQVQIWIEEIDNFINK